MSGEHLSSEHMSVNRPNTQLAAVMILSMHVDLDCMRLGLAGLIYSVPVCCVYEYHLFIVSDS